ncbi:MAG: hypothetical protein CVU77_05225 [Elusimicrobia bacterium HGW-Elusimicrobia-1]|jgi:hypothetical protein|nr:MAG: hypothetical protein CVU77_05225 [Elusimicrobia bacterium HGW-Elusimicrobia-1]
MKAATILLLFFCAVTARAVENYEYFGRFQSLRGYTGGIINPNADILSKKKISLGINKFNVGVLWGITDGIETGVHFNLRNITPFTAFDSENLGRKADEISFVSKVRLFDERDYGFDFALGHRRSVVYWVLERYFPEFYDITLSGGIMVRYRDDPGNKTKLFFTLHRTRAGHRFIYDFDDSDSSQNIGWRFLLSPDVSLDLFLTDFTRYSGFFDNFYFGASIIWL